MSNPIVNHSLPQQVDGQRLCQQGVSLVGTLSVVGLSRLVAVTSHPEGLAEVSLQFDLDEQHRRTVSGTVQVVLQMDCQRCLQEMAWPIKADFDWALVSNDEQASQLPRTLDAVLVEDGHVDLYAAIEDEILLALPFAVQHGFGQCEAPAQTDSIADEHVVPVRENPFQVLVGLKKGSSPPSNKSEDGV